ncbi:MAG TPA: 7-carboxy-7-deazaguanine synthase, partial [Dongiaceae bacterium]
QPTIDPAQFRDLDFRQFWLQPMDGPARQANTDAAVAYCLGHPQWRLSLQTHKLIGIP